MFLRTALARPGRRNPCNARLFKGYASHQDGGAWTPPMLWYDGREGVGPPRERRPDAPNIRGVIHEMPDASSYPPGFNYRHPVYLRVRGEAFARSRGICQVCGQKPAVQAHHWALQYPPAHATTADDLIALCAFCHCLATTIRRFTRAGGSRHQFIALLSEALAKCDLNSPLPACPPSSCTTARSAWPTSTRSWWTRRKLTAWLARGGRRIGLGDWRPEKQGGVFGRFDVEDVIKLADGAAATGSPSAPARALPGGPGPRDLKLGRSRCRRSACRSCRPQSGIGGGNGVRPRERSCVRPIYI